MKIDHSDPAFRDLMGIVYCPGCRQDTMPCERTGICLFCSRQLVAVRNDRRAA